MFWLMLTWLTVLYLAVAVVQQARALYNDSKIHAEIQRSNNIQDMSEEESVKVHGLLRKCKGSP